MVKSSSRIELSQSALKNNITFIRKKIGTDVKISSVVKANAYGHGITPFVKMAEKLGIDHFSVASASEAQQVLRVKNAETQIMIMGILYDSDLEWAIEHEIEFYVFDYVRLPKVKEAAEKVGKRAKIHLELETGGNRTGIPEEEFLPCINYLQKSKKELEFYGLCTHFGGAESLYNQFKVKAQFNEFKKYLSILKRMKVKVPVRHMACSAAAMAYPETVMDMVRIGVVQYGFWPSQDIYFTHLQQVNKQKDNPLRRVISWKTDIMHIKKVKKDQFIGYGTTFQATHDMRVAVLPLGYSDGYSRGLSNNGMVLIHGKKAPVVGLINMNLFMVDISHIPEAQIGDEVVLIGRQKNHTITVSSFTNPLDLLNNEMLSRLPAMIPRRMVK